MNLNYIILLNLNRHFTKDASQGHCNVTSCPMAMAPQAVGCVCSVLLQCASLCLPQYYLFHFHYLMLKHSDTFN